MKSSGPYSNDSSDSAVTVAFLPPMPSTLSGSIPKRKMDEIRTEGLKKTKDETSVDKIMVHSSKSLISAWGSDKQARWGQLTYLAIKLAVTKLQSGKISKVSELFTILSHFRMVIGLILDHPFSTGYERVNLSKYEVTSIIPHQGKYSDLYEELLTEFQELKKEYPHLVQHDKITLLAKKAPYLRTTISTDQKSNPHPDIHLQHVKKSDIAMALQQAEQPFAKLTTESEAPESVKRQLIREIVFYYVDTMPLALGSSAVGQMIYHVLEKSFTGKYSCLGRARSKHGFEYGLSLDIAAMLAVDFSSFDNYFTENIVDLSVSVVDLSDEKVAEIIDNTQPISKEDMLALIDSQINECLLWQKALTATVGKLALPREYAIQSKSFKVSQKFSGLAESFKAMKFIISGYYLTEVVDSSVLSYFLTHLLNTVKLSKELMLPEEPGFEYTQFWSELRALQLKEEPSKTALPFLTQQKSILNQYRSISVEEHRQNQDSEKEKKSYFSWCRGM